MRPVAAFSRLPNQTEAGVGNPLLNGIIFASFPNSDQAPNLYDEHSTRYYLVNLESLAVTVRAMVSLLSRQPRRHHEET
jgi:hypothetical protein